MRYDPELHHRRSIRLKGYDYSRAGAYFLTICCQNRACLLGEIVDGEMRLNASGRMVWHWVKELARKFPDIEHDEFFCMPNHEHAILVRVGADLCVRPNAAAGQHGSNLQRAVQWFKTMTTNGYIQGVRQSGWPAFPGRLWQRNYFERVIRDETEMERIRAYIAANPANWKKDPENPDHTTGGRGCNGVENNEGEHAGSPLQGIIP
jgi:REP element-mobilizing transposase RayT